MPGLPVVLRFRRFYLPCIRQERLGLSNDCKLGDMSAMLFRTLLSTLLNVLVHRDQDVSVKFKASCLPYYECYPRLIFLAEVLIRYVYCES